MQPFLQDFVDLCIACGDVALIVLASINTHLHAVRQWSASVARRWGLILLFCAYGIEEFGSRTGFPFGEYRYTGNFGPMLYDVPLTIPLAWHVVVTNALFIVRSLTPHLSRLMEAGVVGLICVVYDFILEPFATTTKHYWTWKETSVPPPELRRVVHPQRASGAAFCADLIEPLSLRSPSRDDPRHDRADLHRGTMEKVVYGAGAGVGG